MSVSDYCDSEKLIIEVEKRPAIYNKQLPEYSDKNVKEKLWVEVCEAVVPGWCNFDTEERNKKGKDIQRKWKNLRGSFRKELNLQKQTTSGQGKQKRRKYLYFDQLLFLLPTIKERETSGNCSPLPTNEIQEDAADAPVANVLPNNDLPSLNAVQNKTANTNKRRKKPTYEESLLEILKDQQKDDFDEDKSFLLSLWPSVKKLSDQQKLRVKMGFLQVLQEVSYNPPDRTDLTPSVNQHTPTRFPYSQHVHSDQRMSNEDQRISNHNWTAASSTSHSTVSHHSPHVPNTFANVAAVGQYYSSFTPSPQRSPFSPDDSSFLSTSDSELLELR